MPRGNDLFLTYVIINPQAERAKDWSQQADDLVARIVDEDASGITIRGAKMLGTSSIMANEVLVANLQPLKARRGRPGIFLRAADQHQKASAFCRANHTSPRRFRSSTIRCRPGSTRTTR